MEPLSTRAGCETEPLAAVCEKRRALAAVPLELDTRKARAFAGNGASGAHAVHLAFLSPAPLAFGTDAFLEYAAVIVLCLLFGVAALVGARYVRGGR